MPSELFDPLLDLALQIARSGKKSTPPVTPPARVVPLLTFAKVPNKAKDTLLDVIDTDDKFRSRIAEAANEKSVGRVGIAFLQRPEGWETFVANMIAAADEPVIESRSNLGRLERRLETAENARDRALDELATAQGLVIEANTRADDLGRESAALTSEVSRLQASNADLVAQRKRAVTELKQTEAIMARHVAERKRLEAQLEAMTAAQLATTAVGGGITDVEVRSSADEIEAAIDQLRGHVEHLRRQATPELLEVRRRTPLPVPPGLLDDSTEMADYLFAIPKMLVLVDGYNVTREAHDDWELIDQREWLEQNLRALTARSDVEFDVVFDGADVGTPRRTGLSSSVRIRFSPAGVEADDVIIPAVSAIAVDRPVTVVSSDQRVRTGSAERGANVLYSRQLLAIFGSGAGSV